MRNKKRKELVGNSVSHKNKQPSGKTAYKLEVKNGVITQYSEDGSIRVTLGPL